MALANGDTIMDAPKNRPLAPSIPAGYVPGAKAVNDYMAHADAEELGRRHQEFVRRVSRLGPSTGAYDAEDAVQDAAVTVLQKGLTDRVDEKRGTRDTLMSSIVYGHRLAAIRKLCRHPLKPLESDVAESASDTVKEAAIRQLQEMVRTAVRTLSPDQRAAIYEMYGQMGQDDCTASLCSPGAQWVRRCRALAKLAEILAPLWQEVAGSL
jgi:DNA-directed RNA polymerase specialized sigma24 family protein